MGVDLSICGFFHISTSMISPQTMTVGVLTDQASKTHISRCVYCKSKIRDTMGKQTPHFVTGYYLGVCRHRQMVERAGGRRGSPTSRNSPTNHKSAVKHWNVVRKLGM